MRRSGDSVPVLLASLECQFFSSRFQSVSAQYGSWELTSPSHSDARSPIARRSLRRLLLLHAAADDRVRYSLDARSSRPLHKPQNTAPCLGMKHALHEHHVAEALRRREESEKRLHAAHKAEALPKELKSAWPITEDFFMSEVALANASVADVVLSASTRCANSATSPAAKSR